MNISGKHVVLTGGGTGVGAQTARQFSEAGHGLQSWAAPQKA